MTIKHHCVLLGLDKVRVMLRAAKERVLFQMRLNKVPLQHSVQLICKAGGIPLGELASCCGYHRNYLYKSLKGDITPAIQFRENVSNLLGVDPWAYQVLAEFDFEDTLDSIEKILTILQIENIPLQHSVSMIFRAKGLAIGKLAKDYGYHRNHLFQALSGQRQPSTHLRADIAKRLGVDPWDYAPRREVCA